MLRVLIEQMNEYLNEIYLSRLSSMNFFTVFQLFFALVSTSTTTTTRTAPSTKTSVIPTPSLTFDDTQSTDPPIATDSVSDGVWVGLSLTIVVLLFVTAVIASIAIYRRYLPKPGSSNSSSNKDKTKTRQPARPAKKKSGSAHHLMPMPRTPQDVEPSVNDFLDDMVCELGAMKN